jgi:hypothetical protein
MVLLYHWYVNSPPSDTVAATERGAVIGSLIVKFPPTGCVVISGVAASTTTVSGSFGQAINISPNTSRVLNIPHNLLFFIKNSYKIKYHCIRSGIEIG